MKKIFSGAVVLVALLAGRAAAGAPDPALFREGDLVFQSSQAGQGIAVQRATRSPISHVGIVLEKDGVPYVFEAVGTVRYTSLEEWVFHGDGGRFTHKRLRDADRLLTPEALARLRTEATRYEGKSYDLYFGWDDSLIYCSELVWKMYRDALGIELGALQKIRDFDLADPLVRVKLRERYGDAVPLEETVVSPAAVFASPLLEEVTDGRRGL